MPNWCKTDYTVTGKKRSLRTIIKAIDAAMDKEHLKTSPTLFSVMTGLGLSAEDILNVRGERRGFVLDYNYIPEDGILTLFCHTAWDHAGGFERACKTKFPDLDFRYVSIEPGIGNYHTNRPELQGKHVVTIIGDAQGDTFEDEDSLVSILNDRIGCSLTKWDDEAKDVLRRYNGTVTPEERISVNPLVFIND